MQDWGMDVFKVGDALGVGGFGYWDGKKVIRVEMFDSLFCEIKKDGNLSSEVYTTYKGWTPTSKEAAPKQDAYSQLTMFAGSRVVKQEVAVEQSVENFCTGLIKDKLAEFFTKKVGNYTYIATWGPQSLNNDNLGIAVVVKNENLKTITEDKLNHVVVLDMGDKTGIYYYFLGAWEKEPNGIKTREAFEQYLDNLCVELDNPIVVKK
jgi:hypothetical protein